LIRDAQNELKYVDATAHPELVNAISAKLLALQGRGGDTEIAHVTPGEMVLHPDQLSARTRAMIAEDLHARGVDPRTRRVNDQSRVNHTTGAQQFASDPPPGIDRFGVVLNPNTGSLGISGRLPSRGQLGRATWPEAQDERFINDLFQDYEAEWRADPDNHMSLFETLLQDKSTNELREISETLEGVNRFVGLGGALGGAAGAPLRSALLRFGIAAVPAAGTVAVGVVAAAGVTYFVIDKAKDIVDDIIAARGD
ncbi:MAG: hypothetical protein KDE14_13465, partial [Rhodobacteraceae bacterium]|nr:hypothetical protein [Paracoccaceae bacterium]